MVRTVLVVAALLGMQVHAYNLKQDSTGHVVRWSGPVDWLVDAQLGERLEARKVDRAMQGALDELGRNVPSLLLAMSEGPGGDVGYDLKAGAQNRNTISAIDEWPFDPEALAVTVVTVDVRSHRILDADIVFNARHYAFAVIEGEETELAHPREVYDVQNTVTHELGHALGLAHVDELPEAVMYPHSAPGETRKRILSTDDKAGLAALYSSFDGDASSVSEVGCAAAGKAGIGWALLMVAGLVALRRHRRVTAFGVGLCVPMVALADGNLPIIERLAKATLMVRAEVIRTTPHVYTGAEKVHLIVTDVTLRVTHCLRGPCPDEVRVTLLGGRLGTVEQVVEDSPVPKVHDEVLVALPEPAGRLRPGAAWVRSLAQQRGGSSIELPPLQNPPPARSKGTQVPPLRERVGNDPLQVGRPGPLPPRP